MNYFHTKQDPFSLQKSVGEDPTAKLPLMQFPNELLAHIMGHVPPPHFESLVLTCKLIHKLAAPAIQEYNSIWHSLTTMSPYDLLQEIVLNPRLALYPSSLTTWQTDTAFHYSLTLLEKLPNAQRLDISTRNLGSLIERISLNLLTYYEPKPSTLPYPLPFEMLRAVHIQDNTNTRDAMDLAVLLSMIPSVRKLQVSSLCNSDPYDCPYRCYNAGVTELGLQGHVDSSFATDLICRTSHLQNFSYRLDLELQGQPQENLYPQRIVQFLQLEAGHSLTRLKLTIPSCHHPYRRPRCTLFVGSLRRFSTLKTLESSVDFLIQSTILRGASIRGNDVAQRLVDTMPSSLQTLKLDRGLGDWDDMVIRELFRDFSNEKKRYLPNLEMVWFVVCPNVRVLVSEHMIRECGSVGVELSYTLV